MKKHEVYSKFIKAESLLRKDGGYDTITLTIKDQGENTGREQEFENNGKKQYQVVIEFEEDDRALGLNQTNFDSIIDITGEQDTNDWGGKQIEIWVNPKVQFGSKFVPGIRVRKPSGSSAAAPKSAPAGGPPGDDDDAPAPAQDLTALAKKCRDMTEAWRIWGLKFADNPADLTPAWQEMVKHVGKGKKSKEFTPEEWQKVAEGATVPF